MSIIPDVCLSPFCLATGQWCLAWWCFGGAGQLAVMTWCCPPSSFFYYTASGESVSFTALIFFFFLLLSLYRDTLINKKWNIYLFFCIVTSLRLAFIFRLVVLSVVLFGLPYGSDQSCSVTLVDHGRGYLGILVSCLICESAIMWLSMRGSILYTQPREAVQYVLYIRLGEARSLFFLRISFETGLPPAACENWRRWLWGLLVVPS